MMQSPDEILFYSLFLLLVNRNEKQYTCRRIENVSIFQRDFVPVMFVWLNISNGMRVFVLDLYLWT